MRKAQFSRPEPGFSLYEGRTRGKRARYTFSEDEEDYSDAISTRRSTRHSGAITPAEPTVTASGRQVRSRVGGMYGESLTAGQDSVSRQSPATADYQGSEESDAGDGTAEGRKARPGWKGWAMVVDDGPRQHIAGYNEVDAMDEDEDEAFSSGESGDEWDGGDDDDDVIRARDADDEDDNSSNESDSEGEPKSLVVTLKYGKKKAPTTAPETESNGISLAEATQSPPNQAKPIMAADPIKTEPAQAPPDATHRSPLPSHFHTPFASQSTPTASTSTPAASIKTDSASAAPSYTTPASMASASASKEPASKPNEMSWTPSAAPPQQQPAFKVNEAAFKSNVPPAAPISQQNPAVKANEAAYAPPAEPVPQQLPPIAALAGPLPPPATNGVPTIPPLPSVNGAAAPLSQIMNGAAAPPPTIQPSMNGTAPSPTNQFRQGTLDSMFAPKPPPPAPSMSGYNGQ